MKLPFKKLYLAATALVLLAQPAAAGIFNAKTAMLKNGMQVVLIENHIAPVVTHMVWYKVGAADEPQGDGISGAAHFLEHLMFKGSKAIAPGQFSKTIRSWGGEDNAFTSWDYTAYFQSIARDKLPNVMALEAERMINITLPEAEIKTELPVIIEERRQRTDNDPRALFSEQLRAALFPFHPYGIPVIGWKNEMPALKHEHVENYYKTWYAPNNAILVVSGDITMAELLPMAEKYYGFLEYKEVPKHIRPDIPEFIAPQVYTFESADIAQDALIKSWRAPSFNQDKNISYSLQVLEEALDGSAATPLYKKLVKDQKIATSVSFSYEGDMRGDGSIWLYATPAEGVTPEKLETAIMQELQTLAGGELADADIEEAKNRMIDASIYARDSVAGPAMIIGNALASGAKLDDIEQWPQRINALPAQTVRQSLKDILLSDAAAKKQVTGYLKAVAKTAEVTP